MDVETETFCVLRHRSDPERLRRALPGRRVCAGCAERLGRTICELPHLWKALEDELPAVWHDRPGDDSWPLAIAENPLPLQPAIADHRTRIADLLFSWCRLVAEERNETGPAPTVSASAHWLRNRVDWICAQHWVDELGTELADLRRSAFRLLDPQRIRRVPCGPCRDHLEGPVLEGYPRPLPCPGTLVARIGRDPEDVADPTCDVCGAVVPVDHHAALRRGLAGLVDAQAASARLDVPVGTIGRWASSGRLERRGKDARGRTLYRLEDIERLRDTSADGVRPQTRTRLARRFVG